MAPIILALGVNLRIAIDFAGGGLQDFRAGALGQAQHVDRAMHAGEVALIGARYRADLFAPAQMV